MPVVVVLALLIVRVGIAVRNELAVELAAREGARAASVAANGPGAAAAAARRAVDLPIGISTATGATTVTVTATYVDRTQLPLVGRLIGPTTHTARVTMTLEPP